MTQRYVSLHTHSEHSFLDGYSSTKNMAKRAKKIGMTSLAQTDHGEVGGHLSFQKACLAEGIKPIFGMEGYLVDSIAKVREEGIRENSHLCIFAENQTGLKNLWALSSHAYEHGRYYKPLVDWDSVKPFTEGLIVTDGCLLAYMARAILADDTERQVELIGRYIDTFGEDNFFMELHTWQFIEPKTEREADLNWQMSCVNKGKVRLAQKYGIPLIVVNDAHYCEEDEWEHHALVWKMNTFGDDKTDPGKTASWIMTDEEIYYWMDRHGIDREVVAEAIKNTARIAERCNATIEGVDHLPSLTGSDEGDLELYLANIQKGLQKRILDKGIDPAPYLKAIEEENALIVPKRFYKYFNIVADYCIWAKDVAKMLVGPGRGSAGASIVAYMLRITEVDPIKYPELMFSRFLDEGRTGNPDIDLDFPQSRRPEVIQYLQGKYGEGFVSGIGTFSRSGAKAILKDLCRAMDIPMSDADEMTKIVKQVEDLTKVDHDSEEDEEIVSWSQILQERGGDLAPWAKKYPDLFSKMGDMIGMIRQSGAHASGILISDVNLSGVMPVRIKGNNPLPITQFENSETAGDTEVLELGWEKFDILGLRHLDTLEEARQLIQRDHGTWLDYYEWTDEQFTDPKIWEASNRGDTLGLFQIETSGGASVSSRFNIKHERDVADLLSVNRPGVTDAGMLTPFLDRRAGRKPSSTPHVLMDNFLKRTFGVVVYQEQIIRLVQIVANFTPNEADGLRKAVGKKLKDKMDQIKPKFIKGCCDNPDFVRLLKRGERPEVVAQKIWDNIEPAARYSFNNAHAQAYGFITCWEAWVRYYYPREYLTALLRTDPDKVPAYIGWCKKNSIAILPPDINDSEDRFSLSEDGIRYGLTSVRSVGDKSYAEIAAKRPFDSFDALVQNVSKGGFNAAVGTNLISIGALDRWDKREVLLAKFYTQRKIKNKEIPDFYDDMVVGKIEKELVGTYITKNPAEKFSAIIEGECLQTADQLNSLETKEKAVVGGLVTLVKLHRAKTGMMCWITLDWRGEQFELVMFPESYKAHKYFLAEDTPVICEVQRLERGAQIKELVRLDRL